ncbi:MULTISPECIES: cytochrome c family protein [unclassified Rhizobium]|jgi:cytochrome c|uniref:c-type cytochrome n=1 Tax=unclassified Rhizobium TaxID=2613769 RepID=UPI000DD850AA|nr:MULTISPECIES: cytochrome c family protein [unclassified Rhizobium]MBB3386477.1 cytochrome c [Rhizobium sp. BK098]MBB3428798.1 cytochrome c [Rhizobium sp. BK312]MBB3571344.1 cytochrome c [Rhizobium sp. BK491]MBB3618181.1 cytochrome c [Rhizobium sp. BK609]MBB3683838.1 cytochrome c [Rhizobium sp. BK612]
MNSSYVNMGVGALLATLFVLKSVSLASGFIFHSEAPEKPGFAIVATEEPAAGGDKGAAAKPDTPIAQLLQKADAKVGETIFKKCQACHSGEKGGPNKVGPDLWGIVDRPVAEHEGFAYSSGMKDFSKGGTEKWTYDHLYHFLAAPKKFVAGTAMGFAGLPKEEDRANVIAYLRTLADTQVPLPDPNAPAATN